MQVPRILNPVVLVLDSLPKYCKDPHLNNYVNSVFGSVEGCRCVTIPSSGSYKKLDSRVSG